MNNNINIIAIDIITIEKICIKNGKRQIAVSRYIL